MTDQELLRRYVEKSSERAFAQLVDKHLKLVYWTCRRELGDAQLAEDATQVVFILLARKAAALSRDVSISGWLFRTARLASKNTRRRESTQHRLTGRAAVAMEHAEHHDAWWQEIEPVLNDGLSSLAEVDRQAIVLRYIEGLSFGELGGELGLSEDAARMRTSRAVDKLRRRLAKGGIAVGLTVLVAILEGHPAEAVPLAVEASVHGIAGASGVALLDPQSVSVHDRVHQILRAAFRRKLAGAAASGLAAGAIAVSALICAPADIAAVRGSFGMASSGEETVVEGLPTGLVHGTKSPPPPLPSASMAARPRRGHGAHQSKLAVMRLPKGGLTDPYSYLVPREDPPGQKGTEMTYNPLHNARA